LTYLEVPSMKWDFWDWCLAGLLVFGVAMGGLVFLLYALPQEPLVIPEVQASVRVANLDQFPPGAARIQRWGDRLVLVVRTRSGEVTAVEGTSPSDGCALRWDERLAQIRSPCSYQIYSPYGQVIAGLSNQSLRRYPVMIRDGTINIGSGT
jgi:nitrite reductase/ring-hydroxylating ferredoxin subunit